MHIGEIFYLKTSFVLLLVVLLAGNISLAEDNLQDSKRAHAGSTLKSIVLQTGLRMAESGSTDIHTGFLASAALDVDLGKQWQLMPCLSFWRSDISSSYGNGTLTALELSALLARTYTMDRLFFRFAAGPGTIRTFRSYKGGSSVAFPFSLNIEAAAGLKLTRKTALVIAARKQFASEVQLGEGENMLSFDPWFISAGLQFRL